MKKQTAELVERAKDLYVKQQLTFREIGARVGVNERTVRTWKKQDGHWEQEREAYLESKRSFHEELYEFGRELMRSIRQDFKAGDKVDATRLMCFGKILAVTVKPRDYEEARQRKAGNDNLPRQDIAETLLQAMGLADADDADVDEFDEAEDG